MKIVNDTGLTNRIWNLFDGNISRFIMYVAKQYGIYKCLLKRCISGKQFKSTREDTNFTCLGPTVNVTLIFNQVVFVSCVIVSDIIQFTNICSTSLVSKIITDTVWFIVTKQFTQFSVLNTMNSNQMVS